MPQTLLASARYRDFITQRNQALERVRANAQIDLSRITWVMLSQIENLAANAALKAKHAWLTHQVSTQFENGTREIMTQVFPIVVRRLISLRRAAYTLSYAGEQEAVGRATQRRGGDNNTRRSSFAARLKDELSSPTLLGDLPKRVWLDLMNLRRRIVQAFETSVSQDLPAEETMERVRAAFPKIAVYKRPPKALTSLKEADSDPEDERQSWINLSFIDDADWELAVNAYKDTELPPNRFDKSAQWDSENGLMMYQWELEQEATEDFVRSVRSGQVAGAEDMGVKEFVWISIIDKNTCDDCCLPRNGKTTSEIDAMNDECGVTVPPAHFNCRCDIGPVASVNEVEGPDWASFNDFMKQKEASVTAA